MNVYRVWFNSIQSSEVCCVLAVAKNEDEAKAMAIEHVAEFPDLDLDNPIIQQFDTSFAHVSCC